jgi:hypothetical protein
MTQGAQNTFFWGVALLVSLATFIQGGKVPPQFVETLSYRGRGLKSITWIQNFNLLFAENDTTPLPRYGPFLIAHDHNATSAFAITPLMSLDGVIDSPKTNHCAKVELKYRISTQLSLFFIFFIRNPWGNNGNRVTLSLLHAFECTDMFFYSIYKKLTNSRRPTN